MTAVFRATYGNYSALPCGNEAIPATRGGAATLTGQILCEFPLAFRDPQVPDVVLTWMSCPVCQVHANIASQVQTTVAATYTTVSANTTDPIQIIDQTITQSSIALTTWLYANTIQETADYVSNTRLNYFILDEMAQETLFTLHEVALTTKGRFSVSTQANEVFRDSVGRFLVL